MNAPYRKMSQVASMESIKMEENENYLFVLLQIMEDANEKARLISQALAKTDWFINYPKNKKRDEQCKKKLHKLVKVLEEEVIAERARQLKMLRCSDEKERNKLELEVMIERCNSADDLMQLLGPGSKYVGYLAVVVNRSSRVPWDRTAHPSFGRDVCNPLSNLPLFVRKSYRCKPMMNQFFCRSRK